MTAKEIIALIAPEFDSVSETRIDGMIALVTPDVGAVFGDNQTRAIALLACHQLTMSARAGVGGVIVSEAEGSVSRSYATVGGLTGALDSTSYGQEFKTLRKQCVFAPRTKRM